MRPPRTAVPDLLKRFVATPYKLIAQGFVLETNDIELLEAFDLRDQLDAFAAIARDFNIRVVRDSAAPTEREETRTVCGESVCAVLVGMGTIIMVDREQRRVLSFVAPNISRMDIVQTYLPMAIMHASHHQSRGQQISLWSNASRSESLQTSDKLDNRV